jgi:transcriptional regulator GlxA family with amidase domain
VPRQATRERATKETNAGVRGVHPAVVEALAGLQQQRSIEALVRESRYSHRHFDALFRSAVGVGPKAYARVLRFREALRLLASHRDAPLVAIASRAGYSDQAHFTRAFVEMAGVTPSVYRSRSPTASRHLPLPTRAS